MKDLQQFIKLLHKLFSDQEGLKIDYSRKGGDVAPIGIWMQKYLDELGITEFSFFVHKNEIIVKSYRFELDPVGFNYHQFPYSIKLKDENNKFTPKNIEAVSIKF